MRWLRRSFFRALGLAVASAAAPAWSAPVVSAEPAQATVELLAPTSLQKLQDLDFATLVVTGAGTATVDPNTDAITTSGGVTHLSGLPHAALFEDSTRRRGATFIRIPSNPVTLTRQGGTETMTVTNWTISNNVSSVGGGRYKFVAAAQIFQFKVGGTLNVSANQEPGLYVGEFTVDVEYP